MSEQWSAGGTDNLFVTIDGVKYRFELSERLLESIPKTFDFTVLVESIIDYNLDEAFMGGVLVTATKVEDGYLDGEVPESTFVWYRLDAE